jgi:hypothetical protein
MISIYLYLYTNNSLDNAIIYIRVWLASRAEPVSRAREMGEPSRARSATEPHRAEPSRARLGSFPALTIPTKLSTKKIQDFLLIVSVLRIIYFLIWLTDVIVYSMEYVLVQHNQ